VRLHRRGRELDCLRCAERSRGQRAACWLGRARRRGAGRGARALVASSTTLRHLPRREPLRARPGGGRCGTTRAAGGGRHSAAGPRRTARASGSRARGSGRGHGRSVRAQSPPARSRGASAVQSWTEGLDRQTGPQRLAHPREVPGEHQGGPRNARQRCPLTLSSRAPARLGSSSIFPPQRVLAAVLGRLRRHRVRVRRSRELSSLEINFPLISTRRHPGDRSPGRKFENHCRRTTLQRLSPRGERRPNLLVRKSRRRKR
jgi:hypothetical protein